MNERSFTLTLFAIPVEVAAAGLVEATRVLFKRSGFEIVFDKAKDTLNALAPLVAISGSFGDWFVGLDLIPWPDERAELKSIIWDHSSANHRVEWSIYGVTRFLRRQVESCGVPNSGAVILSEKSFRGVTSSVELMQKFEYFYPLVAKEIRKKVDDFRPKYEIVRPLTNYGCNNRIDLVRHNGSVCICKKFKPDRLRYLENEVEAREELGQLVRIPPILTKGDDYILIEYVPGLNPVSNVLTRFNLISVRTLRRIFRDLMAIYQRGYYHLDFHPRNILIDGTSRLVYVDFEYIQNHDFGSNLLDSPVLIPHDKLKYDSPLEDISYEAFWAHLVQMPARCVVKAPLALLYLLRATIITEILYKRYKTGVKRRIISIAAKYA